jgi:uncharacterized membrane protein YeaQ/YmgE (transglycosylase-associated protein family)
MAEFFKHIHQKVLMHLHLILEILCGIIVGWLAGIVVQGKGMGLLPNLIIGALGAFLGAVFIREFHIHVATFWGALGVSVGGAVVLLIVLRIIKND